MPLEEEESLIKKAETLSPQELQFCSYGRGIIVYQQRYRPRDTL
jgi:hypothetical protein